MIDLRHGSNLDVLPNLADNSVDSIVTDPPYELGFMGKSWDASGIAYNVDLWRECLRVLKPGGHLLAFSGSRTYHRMTCAIEDAGFEVRDQIMWVYGSGFPKSHNLTGDWQGWGTALKPAHEPICVARKPLIGTVAANVLAHGTGAINVDGCRVGTETIEQHRKPQKTWREREGRTDIPDSADYSVTTTEGRWPANLIHDGSEEVTERMGEPARFFYCAKASKRDRDDGLEGFATRHGASITGRTIGSAGIEMANGKQNPYAGKASPVNKNTHPTVKPTDLMRYLCRLVTQPGGVILDPFMGSGSTGKAAVLEGFQFIGIDMTAEYIAIADARIKHAMQAANDNVPQPDLLTGIA